MTTRWQLVTDTSNSGNSLRLTGGPFFRKVLRGRGAMAGKGVCDMDVGDFRSVLFFLGCLIVVELSDGGEDEREAGNAGE